MSIVKIEASRLGGSREKSDPWMEALRDEKPELFEAPPFWPVDGDSIERIICGSRRGEVMLLGSSAGGKSIHGICYGEYEPQRPTATISSAMASDRPAAFYDATRRTRPVLAVIGSIHGGETEGIALCMNLISLMEHGHDLRGREHGRLSELLARVRLVLVPCLNPDGRATAEVAHLSGAERDDLFLVQQGIRKDGSLFFGRKIKEISPIPPGYLRRMGGYYNASGVNLQHDDFFGPRLAPENTAIMNLFRREVPDAFLGLHAHGAPAAFITPDAYLAPGYQRKQVESAGFILSRLMAAGIAVLPPDRIVTPPWSFYFQTWLYQMTGALPLLFEFCHGLKGGAVATPESNLETGFILMESWVEYCLTFGARPGSPELFAPVAPAH